MSAVITKTYVAPPFCEKEILRYAGCKTADEGMLALLRSCLEESKDTFVYRVCYTQLPVTTYENTCDFGAFCLRSERLAKNLLNAAQTIVFAATVGVEIDRLIARYGRLSPSRALMLQAIGAERIETLCDLFCRDIQREQKIKIGPRFSPGYGDLSLQAQKEIFAVLDPSKKIGVYLNESMLMSPSKSVTAFVGFTDTMYETNTNKCAFCEKKDCEIRREK